MKFFIILCLSITLLPLSSCAGKRKDFAEPAILNGSTGYTKRVYGSSYSGVWESAIQVMAAHSIPLNLSRKDHGLIITDWIIEKSDRLYSGYGETKIPYKIRYKMKLTIKPTKRGIEVEIDSREQFYSDSISAGTNLDGSLYRWIDTKSSGNKEGKILDDIAQILSTLQTSS